MTDSPKNEVPAKPKPYVRPPLAERKAPRNRDITRREAQRILDQERPGQGYFARKPTDRRGVEYPAAKRQIGQWDAAHRKVVPVAEGPTWKAALDLVLAEIGGANV